MSTPRRHIDIIRPDTDQSLGPPTGEQLPIVGLQGNLKKKIIENTILKAANKKQFGQFHVVQYCPLWWRKSRLQVSEDQTRVTPARADSDLAIFNVHVFVFF